MLLILKTSVNDDDDDGGDDDGNDDDGDDDDGDDDDDGNDDDDGDDDDEAYLNGMAHSVRRLVSKLPCFYKLLFTCV